MYLNKQAQMVTFPNYVQEVPGSDIGQDTDSAEFFLIFLSPSKANSSAVPQIRLQLILYILLNSLFLNHHIFWCYIIWITESVAK